VQLDTRSGDSGTRKVKGTIHWVEAGHAVPVQIALYDRLFKVPNPDDVPEGGSFIDHINPDSNIRLEGALAEPSLAEAEAGDRFQFERQGYFVVDSESSAGTPVFNRTVTLRDTWAKIAARRESGSTAKAARPPSVTTAPRAESTRIDSGPAIPTLDASQKALAGEFEVRYGMAYEDAALLAAEDPLRAFFEEAARSTAHPLKLVNWVVHELQRERKGRPLAEMAIRPEHLGELVNLIEAGTISGRQAKTVFAQVIASGDSPGKVVADQGLSQIDDLDTLIAIAADVAASFPDRAEAYRQGKTGLMGFFVGQLMRATGGRANPQRSREALDRVLSESDPA
jgi:glutaminyl-tRNA synthetase